MILKNAKKKEAEILELKGKIKNLKAENTELIGKLDDDKKNKFVQLESEYKSKTKELKIKKKQLEKEKKGLMGQFDQIKSKCCAVF